MIRVEAADIEHARKLLNEEGPVAMYDFLASKGDRYAVLANGVAKGDSVAGVVAINFMTTTAEIAGRPISDGGLEKIKFELGVVHLDTLKAKLRDGVVLEQINHLETSVAHKKVFEANNQTSDAWTLYAVLSVLKPESREDYWQSVLRAAGDLAAEAELVIKTNMIMSTASAIAPESERKLAKSWISRVDSPSSMVGLAGAVSDILVKSITGAFSDLLGTDPETSTTPPLQIDITPNPEPRQQIQGEDQVREDISAGFVNKSATHSIAFTDDTLNKTDFTSAQMGSFATGGIRPGELQLDPNVRPNAHLSQFYREGSSTEGPDFSLRNAVVLNGLAAMTTVNTYVDPLLLDLSGNGVGMTPIEDGVLFDVDNSGALRHTGWADRVSGMLVLDDGSGEIKNISQLFSEYYAGKAGANGGAGETPFKDGFAALASEDKNADGSITPEDAIWRQIKVWVDGDHDAGVGAGELKTLDELGITAIKVDQPTAVGEVREGNQVIARSTFTLNGVDREMLAVKFLADTVNNQIAPHDSGNKVVSTAQGRTTSAYVSQGTVGEMLDADALGVNNLYGAGGDDVLKAAAAGSWLVGGAGSNTYVGGAGDDVFVISASDDQSNIRGNGGRDTVLIVGERGVGLNMAEAGLTIAQGGRGQDIIASGGSRGVFIKGGSGDSILIGGGGNDVLVGGTGRNTIIGGSAKSVIYAGPLGDTIYASDGGSIIYAGGGADQINGGAADDVIEAGAGDAVIDGAGGSNVLSLHGSHDEYQIARTDKGYEVTDKVTGRDGKLTLTNIQKVSFSDISSVDLSLPNAMPVADIVTREHAAASTEPAQPQIIPAATLLANDQPLNSSGPLRISALSDAKGATVRLTEQGDVEVLPRAGYTGVINFKYSVVDAAGNPSATIIDLDTAESAPMRATVTLRSAQAPLDPLSSRQWYLDEINVLPVWSDYTGKGVRIGQFEPGGQFAVSPEIFDIQHPDLQSNVDFIWLKTQQTNGTLPVVVSNHATQVAGVMVAARNTQGGIGVAYEATLGGHYLANSGEDLTSLGQMVNYDIANNSWGFRNDFALTSLQNGAINTATALATNARYAAGNGRGGLGTIIVAAGGNARIKGGSAQGSLTNNNRFTIEVGAINVKGDLSTLQVASAPFSNPGTSLLISAPGSNVLSSSHALQTERGSTVGNTYSATQGTSFAAPIVSGVVALMLQANPGLGYRDVQQILALSARKVDDPAARWSTNASRNWNGGGMHASDDYGFGAVDARAAVRMAESWVGQASAANEKVLSASSEKMSQVLAAGQVSSFSLTMAAGVLVEHVEIDFDASVGRLGDLTVKLVSPSGTESLLLNRAGKAPSSGEEDLGSLRAGEFRYTFMSTHDWGERSEGVWKLEVTNSANGLPLTLNQWALRVSGAEANSDDTYFFTDEFSIAVADQPDRGKLDDAINGTAGGRNTLNAAAVSGDVSINLSTGMASIAGAALTLGGSGIHNLISGDGNDTLTAGSDNALLDAGRGRNTLVGGVGKDVFVVRRRLAGNDEVQNFDLDREVIDLVGFTNKQFGDLHLEQQGSGVKVALGNEQFLMLANRNIADFGANHFRFQDKFVAPSSYVDSRVSEEQTSSGAGTVLLSGGGGGVGYTSDATGQLVASLTGTVYSRDDAAVDVFVVVKQEGVDNYRNALRGFRHGVDKIDLSQTGIGSFDDLVISKEHRATINNLSQIHGVSVRSSKLSDDGRTVELLYLDALELAQLTRDDFVFAQPGSLVSTSAELQITAQVDAQMLALPAMTTVDARSLPNVANLIDSMAAFSPPSFAASRFSDVQPLGLQPLIAVNG